MAGSPRIFGRPSRAASVVLACAATLALALVAWTQETVTQPKRLSAPGTVIEAESLVPKAKVSAGPLTVQHMHSFGPQWGGGAQLFWRPPAPVDKPIRNWPHLMTAIEVPTTGEYSVVLYYTVAPDFGNFRVFINGEAVKDVSGFAPAVELRKVELARKNLKAGSQQVALTVFAKEPASTNFFVGLDRFEVRRTHAAAGSASAAVPLGPEVAVVAPDAAAFVAATRVARPPVLRREFSAVQPYNIAFGSVPPSPSIDIKFPALWRDLRPTIAKKGIQIRDQGNRGTCSIFATTFLLEYLYATQKNWNFQDLSEEYLNYATNLACGNKQDGDFFSNIDLGYQTWGTYPEGLVPYHAVYEASYVVPKSYMDIGKKWYRFTPDFIKPWENTKGATQAQIEKVIAYLDQGLPVGLGCLWPRKGKAVTMQYMSDIDVMVAVPKSDVEDGHSVALVGYWKHNGYPGGGFFIFRNSWGTDFGDQGYGYMSFDYVSKYANDLLAYHP